MRLTGGNVLYYHPVACYRLLSGSGSDAICIIPLTRSTWLVLHFVLPKAILIEIESSLIQVLGETES